MLLGISRGGGEVIGEVKEPEMVLKNILKEVLTMEVLAGKCFETNAFQYKNFKIKLIAYTSDFVSASFQLTDHDDWSFLAPKEFGDYKFAAAVVPFISALFA